MISLFRKANLGIVVRQRRREVAVGVDLHLKIGDLLLDEGDGIGAGDEAARGLLFARDLDQRLCELGGVAGLLAGLGLPPLHLLRSALVVVVDGRFSKGHRLFRDKLRTEEPRVDDGGGDWLTTTIIQVSTSMPAEMLAHLLSDGYAERYFA